MSYIRLHKKWVVVLVIGLVLGWAALGHPGPENISDHRMMLTPFVTHLRNLRCIFGAVARCGMRTAIRSLLIDGAGNVVAFIPFGAAVAAAAKQHQFALAAGGLLSLGFEIIQWWIPGRVVSTDEFLLNTADAAIGSGLVVAFQFIKVNQAVVEETT